MVRQLDQREAMRRGLRVRIGSSTCGVGGRGDLDVPPTAAERTAERMRARGTDVQAIDVGDVDHNRSLLEAIPLLRGWFDEILRGESL